MSSLAWKLARMRRMGGREILYRTRRAGSALLERAGIGLAAPGPMGGSTGHPWISHLPSKLSDAPYRESAERILAGRFDIFSSCGMELGFPPRWSRDPKTGRIAPEVFGTSIDYRDEALVGDIKYLWEINRHSALVVLAQAWYLTRERRYATGCRTLLESWFDECPYPRGVNWASSLEAGLRLTNWSVAWHLLEASSSGSHTRESQSYLAEPGQLAFRNRWLRAVFQHCHFIAGHLSLHSSANNHLLGELMGLFIGATAWPLWSQSTRWRRMAAVCFEREALLQNAPDGVNREQASGYHRTVAEMMLLTMLVGRANGHEFSSQFQDRLQRMLEFLAAIMDSSGNVPMIGDSDDAVVLPWAPVDANRSLLASGAVLFGRADFRQKAGAFDHRSRWLLGDEAEATFDGLSVRSTQPPAYWDFPQGGYTVFGDCLDAEGEIRIVADAGLLGYLSIAAHGHADALAFTLSLDGREFLVDPGTYAYHGMPAWRAYFRGTSAHNTVRVDGLDQSVAGGAFMWMRHARAWRERFEDTPESAVWTAGHDGYRRLRDPVGHWRTIGVDKKSRVINVADRLECKGRHRVEIFWHVAEACSVSIHGRQVVLRNGAAALLMELVSPGWTPVLVRGCEAPPLGWISRRYNAKTPCDTVVWSGEIDGSTVLRTVMSIEAPPTARGRP